MPTEYEQNQINEGIKQYLNDLLSQTTITEFDPIPGISIGMATERGGISHNPDKPNQDSIGLATLGNKLLAVLGDGIGGSRDGEVASNLLVKIILKLKQANADMSLEDAVDAAHQAIIDFDRLIPMNQVEEKKLKDSGRLRSAGGNMGTTLVALEGKYDGKENVLHTELALAGDSYAIVFTPTANGGFRTNDLSEKARKADTGWDHRERRSVLVHYLGSNAVASNVWHDGVHMLNLDLPKGSWIALYSDGLTLKTADDKDHFTTEDFRKIIEKGTKLGLSAQQISSEIMKAVNERAAEPHLNLTHAIDDKSLILVHVE